MVENLVWALAVVGGWVWGPQPTSSLPPSLVQLTTSVDIGLKQIALAWVTSVASSGKVNTATFLAVPQGWCKEQSITSMIEILGKF